MVSAIVRYRSCKQSRAVQCPVQHANCELGMILSFNFCVILRAHCIFWVHAAACVRVRVRSRALDCAQSGSGTCKAACFWWDPRTTDTGTPRENFFQKSQTFGLGQTNWAEFFWGIWGIFGQTISTHFGTVIPLSMFSIIQQLFLQKTRPFTS